MTRGDLQELAAQYGLDEEEAIDAVLASIKAPFALMAFKAWKMTHTDTEEVALDRAIERMTGVGA